MCWLSVGEISATRLSLTPPSVSVANHFRFSCGKHRKSSWKSAEFLTMTTVARVNLGSWHLIMNFPPIYLRCNRQSATPLSVCTLTENERFFFHRLCPQTHFEPCKRKSNNTHISIESEKIISSRQVDTSGSESVFSRCHFITDNLKKINLDLWELKRWIFALQPEQCICPISVDYCCPESLVLHWPIGALVLYELIGSLILYKPRIFFKIGVSSLWFDISGF